MTKRSGPSRVTGIGEAKPHRKAFPDGRQVRGKTRRSIGVRVRPHRDTLRLPTYQTDHRCKSQAAGKLAFIN
jgi:hypothetical protein